MNHSPNSLTKGNTENLAFDDEVFFAHEIKDCCMEKISSEIGIEISTVWKIMIVDDEPTVHRATQLALRNLTFAGQSVVFISAYSGEEGKSLISQHSDIALILLDVVMETHDAGLTLVKYIREQLNNRQVRIILRTGHPGEAPEESVILNYDINDYKLKVELTRQRLLTSVISALRSYQDILTINQQNIELAQILEDLKQTQEQLKEYSYTLEFEVSKRTLALEKANQALQRLALLDGLTQVANRRRFDEYLQQQWMLSIALNQPLSLILTDVDEFKNYNDYYGHLAGDDCLKQVAQSLSHLLKRPTDLVARYGGEEFAIVLPQTSIEGAIQVAKAILQDFQLRQIPHAKSSISDRITLSLGLSSIVPQKNFSLDTLITTADKALYQAKHEGRNRYCIYKTLQLGTDF